MAWAKHARKTPFRIGLLACGPAYSSQRFTTARTPRAFGLSQESRPDSRLDSLHQRSPGFFFHMRGLGCWSMINALFQGPGPHMDSWQIQIRSPSLNGRITSSCAGWSRMAKGATPGHFGSKPSLELMPGALRNKKRQKEMLPSGWWGNVFHIILIISTSSKHWGYHLQPPSQYSFSSLKSPWRLAALCDARPLEENLTADHGCVRRDWAQAPKCNAIPKEVISKISGFHGSLESTSHLLQIEVEPWPCRYSQNAKALWRCFAFSTGPCELRGFCETHPGCHLTPGWWKPISVQRVFRVPLSPPKSVEESLPHSQKEKTWRFCNKILETPTPSLHQWMFEPCWTDRTS